MDTVKLFTDFNTSRRHVVLTVVAAEVTFIVFESISRALERAEGS